MDEKEMIWIATEAIAQDMDYSKLYYSGYMYGREIFTDNVWEYVTECKEIGLNAFYDEYQSIMDS